MIDEPTESDIAALESFGLEKASPPEADLAEAAHLLIIDDDTRLRSALRRYLTRSGFRVSEASTAADARAKLESFAFDLLILDIMMPGESGLDLLSSLRRSDRVPVLMLSAMMDVDTRIDGLERGADDYLAKPFEPRELVLRIRNILSRVPPAPVAAAQNDSEDTGRYLNFGECRFDLVREELTRNGAHIHLTSGETSLLAALAKSAGEALSRDLLTFDGQLSGGERTIDVQITRLRRKIEANPKFPEYLQTVRGVGYVLKPD